MHQQQLVDADRRQKRGAVIVQAPVPHSVLKLEQMLKLRVERFNADVAAGIQHASALRTKEAATLVTQSPVMLPLACFPVVRLTHLPILRSRDLRAHKAATRAAVALPLHRLGDRVAVVTRIRQDKLGRSRQNRNLFQNCPLFRAARSIDGRRQRPSDTTARRRDCNLVGIALNPAVVVRVAPRGFGIHATRHTPPPTIPGLPNPSATGDQTLIDGHTLRLSPAALDRRVSLENDRLPKETMRTPITIIKRATARHGLTGHPAFKVRVVLPPPNQLGRFGLFLKHDPDHNHDCQYPIRDCWFAPWSPAWTRPLGPLADRDASPYQFFQWRAVRGSPSHSENSVLLVSLLRNNDANRRRSPDLDQLNSRIASRLCVGMIKPAITACMATQSRGHGTRRSRLPNLKINKKLGFARESSWSRN